MNGDIRNEGRGIGDKPIKPARRLNKHDRAIKLRIFRMLVAFAVVALIALFHFLLPFQSLYPALDITARAEGELRLHFVSVGQGDATVVEFPSGNVLLIDGGDGTWDMNARLVRYVKGLRPKEISYVVTHADKDHFGGIKTVIETLGGKTLYLPPQRETFKAYSDMLASAEKQGLNQTTLTRYFSIYDQSGAYVVCISPLSTESGFDADGNDGSIVLYLQYGAKRALFCGDITSVCERRLVAENAIDESIFDVGDYSVLLSGIDVLKVAHHGSANSTSAEFANLLAAKTAVISCGKGNAYGHPTAKAVGELKHANADAQIVRLDENGDFVVSFYVGGGEGGVK